MLPGVVCSFPIGGCEEKLRQDGSPASRDVAVSARRGNPSRMADRPARSTYLIICSLLGSLSTLTASAAHGQLVRAAWLAGCWEARAPGRVVEEQWMAPRGHSMISMGRTVHGDTLIDFEQVILREAGGRLEYEAHPMNQPSAIFTSTQITDNNLLFENQMHDYPQRVGYTRRGADSLLAWIDGTTHGERKRVDFFYARVTCGT